VLTIGPLAEIIYPCSALRSSSIALIHLRIKMIGLMVALRHLLPKARRVYTRLCAFFMAHCCDLDPVSTLSV
jgi:hypothetical protein